MGRGRPSSGGVKWEGGEWKTRVPEVSSPTGYKWIIVEQGLREDQVDEARALARLIQADWRGHVRVPVERDRTNEENFALWNESPARRQKYPNQVVSDRQMWSDHVPLWFRQLPTRATTNEHGVRVVAELDAEARKPRGERKFGPGRAANVWAVVLAFFRDLSSGKDPDVRLPSFANPIAGVLPPDAPKGRALYQQLLWPEFEALVACPEVPIARARLWATMTYTQTRIGEARVFEVVDLDTKNRRIRINKALDPERGQKKTGKTKTPKAGRPREMRMEAHLVPLLELLIEECGGKGRIFQERPAGAPQAGTLTDEQTDVLRREVAALMCSPKRAAKQVTGRPRTAVRSQQEIAARLAVTQATLSCLVNRTRRASVELGEKIAKARGTTLAKLLGWTRPEAIGASPYIPGTSKACEVFRADLRTALAWAGIEERPELFDDSDLDASQPIRSHDCRATGITARHARGDNAMLIRQEVGHADEDVNQLYVRSMLDVDAARVLGPLPPRLLGGGTANAAVAPPKPSREFCRNSVGGQKYPPKNPRNTVPEEGVEPPT